MTTECTTELIWNAERFIEGRCVDRSSLSPAGSSGPDNWRRAAAAGAGAADGATSGG